MDALAGAAARHRAVLAAGNGRRLHVACSLTYAFGGSDKFHQSMLVDRWVLVRYGRAFSRGEVAVKEFASAEKAAAHYWGLLRGKVAKGYLVADAQMTHTGSVAEALARRAGDAAVQIARNALVDWAVERRGPGAGDRDSLPRLTSPAPSFATSGGRGFAPRSPRTPAQGKKLLLGLTDPYPDTHIMVECALAGESEAYLVPLALSHPHCPEEARVARGLADLASAL